MRLIWLKLRTNWFNRWFRSYTSAPLPSLYGLHWIKNSSWYLYDHKRQRRLFQAGARDSWWQKEERWRRPTFLHFNHWGHFYCDWGYIRVGGGLSFRKPIIWARWYAIKKDSCVWRQSEQAMLGRSYLGVGRREWITFLWTFATDENHWLYKARVERILTKVSAGLGWWF